MTSPFLTVEEVAVLLRVPESRIYEWSRSRQIPAYRGGKRLLFDREEVLSWFKATFQTQQSLVADARRRPRRIVRRRRARVHHPGPAEFKGEQVAHVAG